MRLPYWKGILRNLDRLHDRIIQVYLKESIALKADVDLLAERVSDRYENRALSINISLNELQTPMTLESFFPIRPILLHDKDYPQPRHETEPWIDLYEVSSKETFREYSTTV